VGSFCSLVLIESLAITQEIETIYIVTEFPEPIPGKRRDRVFVVRGIPLAPIKQRQQETQDSHAIHGIARGDLANPASLSQRLNNADATAIPILP
jgi:hypothetical protein